MTKKIQFTKREIECAELLVRHISIEQIVGILKLSPNTIGFYLTNMRQKTGCKSNTELIEWLSES